MRRPSERLERAAFAVVFVLLGAVVGYGLTVTATPEARTPSVCVKALDRAADLDELQGELLYQVRLRGDALGKDDYKELDDEVVRLLAEMGPAEAAYASAKASCLDAS